MSAKKTTFKFILLGLMMLLSTGAISQVSLGILKGKITDKDNSNKAIESAKIVITSSDKKTTLKAVSSKSGEYEIKDIPAGKYYFKVEHKFYADFRRSGIEIVAGKTTTRNASLVSKVVPEPVIMEVEENEVDDISVSYDAKRSRKMTASYAQNNSSISGGHYHDQTPHNTEGYDVINENVFKSTQINPLSTFSVDVDAASYSNVRRFLLNGQKPTKGAVRVEEMINYFNYDYEDPKDNTPFSIATEVGECPWSDNKLVHVGLQGKRIDKSDLPPSNLVFLLDVSGSMGSANKLPLLKKSFSLLVNELSERDKVSIVVYAGAAGLVLEPTPGSNGTKIMEALNKLNSGGSTAGGAGIELAYKTAQQNFIKGGNNRVILATDGDFNIGMSSNSAMEELIVKKRESGIFLTCLGFGTGNYQDSKMEILADKGNGNYAYIDNLLEAKKVLVTEIGATLLTIAKDVKIQVEFNPSVIESYRLIGYENRLLNDEDFNDDKKDAGEIGAGHSVTALYEVVMKGEGKSKVDVDPLKYQDKKNKSEFGNELLTVKFRYKEPDEDTSKLLERVMENKIQSEKQLSNAFKFSAAVAEFGMLLTDSEHKEKSSFDHVLAMAKAGMGKDKNGYRAEFIRLVDVAKVVYGVK
ncbi:MAG: von Willebrand factor type A domain-containing protein [Crocinitomicaceae bacterium]